MFFLFLLCSVLDAPPHNLGLGTVAILHSQDFIPCGFLWIRQVIIQAYGLKDKVPFFYVKVHFIRTFQHQPFVSQIVRLPPGLRLTQLSYQVDFQASSDASFGCRVLQAAL